jgi:hypothetical protein
MDLAQEVINKLDQIRTQELNLSSFSNELTELLNKDTISLFKRLVKSSDLLLRSEHKNKEAPDMFNIIFDLLADAFEEEEDYFALTKVITKIVTFKKDSAEVRLIVLGNLYNAAFIAPFKELRIEVLATLVKYAGDNNKISTIASFLEGHKEVASFLASVSFDIKRPALLNIYEALHKYGDAPALEQTYLIMYLATFNSDEEKANINLPIQKLACTAIGASIGNVLAAQGRMLLNLGAVRSLENAKAICSSY